MPTTVPDLWTTQVPALSHSSVIPFEAGKFTMLAQVYDPTANVMTAPSEALLIADCTSPLVAPAGQVKAIPLPAQAALNGRVENRSRKRAARIWRMRRPDAIP